MVRSLKLGHERGRLRLRLPREDDKAVFEISRQEFTGGSIPFAFGYDETTDFHEYLNILENYRQGINLPEGHVPALFMVAEVSGIVVGRIILRLRLNRALSLYGGHIGYAVRPNFRERGYGKEMLLESRRIAKKLGIKRLLICTPPSNEASRRVILACGGEFECEVQYDDGLVRHRYWITLDEPKRQSNAAREARAERQQRPIKSRFTPDLVYLSSCRQWRGTL